MTSTWNNGIRLGGCLRNKNERNRWLDHPPKSLKKSKNDKLGWLQPPGTFKKKKIMKKASNREVYRQKEKFGLLPARKMWLIEMDPLWCADLTLINSKFLMKLLWTIDTNEMIGITAEGYEWALKNYKRSWLQVCGPTMYERMLPIEPMQDEFVDCSPEGNMRIRKLLARILTREGGVIAMSNRERETRPDAVGDIHKTSMGYIAYPCAPSTPVVQCGVCNCFNLFSHIDTGEKIDEVQWRCAACYADLKYEIEQTADFFISQVNFDKRLGITGGSQLDELMLMQYGDVYDDLTLKAQQDFVAKDVALIRKYFNNAYQCVVEIGVNLSEVEKSSLRNEFPRLYYVFKPRSSHGSKTTMYTVLSMIADNRPRGRKTPVRVSGFNCEMHPIGMAEDAEENNPEIIVLKDKLWSPREIVEATVGTVKIVCPILNTDYTGISSQITVGGIIYYQFGPTGTVGQINPDTLHMLTKYDAVITDNAKFTIQVLQETPTWQLYAITRLQHEATLEDWRKINRVKACSLEIPLPDFYGALSNEVVQTWKRQRVRFDPQLLNMLIIRNITGTLGFYSLREFAVGYAMRSYSAQGSIARNLHIMYEMVDAHTLIALLICSSMKASTSLNSRVVDLQSIPVLKSAGIDLANELVKLVQEGTKLLISQLIGVRSEILWKNLAFSTGQLVPGWDQADNSLDQLVCQPVTTLAPLRWARHRLTSALGPSCGHHVECECTAGKPSCLCCRWAMAGKNGLCKCCASCRQLDHDNYSKYIAVDRWTEQQPQRTLRRPQKQARGANTPTTIGDKPAGQLVAAANRAVRKLRQEAISSEDNEYVTPDNVELSMCMRNPTEYFIKNELQPTSNWKSVIRYNFKDDISHTVNWFEVVRVDMVPDNPKSNCARESFMASTGINLPEDVLMGDDIDGLTSAKEIIARATKSKINMAIFHDAGALIHQAHPSKEFATIIHGSLIDKVNNNHFMAGEVKQIGLIRNYPNRVWHVTQTLVDECIQTIDPSMHSDDVSHNVALQVDSMIRNDILDVSVQYTQLLPRAMMVNGIAVFSNNPEVGVHNVYAGHIHTEIRAELLEAFNLIHKEEMNSHQDISIRGPFDRLTLNIDNLEEDLNTELKAEVLNWLTTVNTFNEHGRVNHHDVKAHLTSEIIASKGLFEMDNPNQKIKTLDIGFISVQSRMMRVMFIVDRQRNKLILRPSGSLVAGKHKVYILKSSFSSLMRKLCNAGSPNIKFKHSQQLMENMRLICGDGGSGKTETLVRDLTRADLVVAMTEAPIITIKERLKKFAKENLQSRIMTLERASTSRPTVTGTIYADEAKQLSLMSLLPIITMDTKSIVLVGDTSQAGAVDMLSYAIGERKVFNLTEVVKPENVLRLKGSKRVGYGLADQVRLLKPDFVGNPEKITTWKLHHLTGLTEKVEGELKSLIQASLPNVILSAQHENVLVINKLTSSLKNIEVSTIFGYQSKEAARVMLVIMPTSSGKFGISRDRWLMISALTRAYEHIDIVMINSTASEKTVDQIVDVTGGALFSKASFELPLEQQQVIADDMASRYPGTTVTVERVGSGTTYKIVGPITALSASMHYNKGKVTVTGNKMMQSAITANIDTTDVQMSDDGVVLDGINLEKLRALAWIIDSIVSTELGMKFYTHGHYYRLAKTKSCPYNAGITLWRTAWLSKPTKMLSIISDGPMGYMGQRKMAVIKEDDFTQELLSWLEVKISGRQYVGTSDFERLRIPYNLNGKLLYERLARGPLCMLNALQSCSTANNCKEAKSVMEPTITSVLNQAGLKLSKPMVHVVCHDTLLVMKKTWTGGLSYDVFDGTESVTSRSTKWDLFDQLPIWQMALDDTRNLTTPKICGELEGLNMSLAKHKEHRTAAYTVYRNKMSAIKSYTINALDNTVWVSRGRLVESKTLIQTTLSNIYVNEHNYKVADQLTELLDGYLLLAVGKMAKGLEITYAGLEPILPSLYNMHYMKLWYSSVDAVRLTASQEKFSQALDQVKSFLTAVTEDVTVDIMDDVRATVVTDPTKVGVRVVLGTAMMYTPLDAITRWLKSGAREVFGLVPTRQVDERLAMLVRQGGSHYLVSNFSGVQAPLQPDVLMYASGCVPQRRVSDTEFIQMETVDTILGMALIKVTLQPVDRPFYTMIEPVNCGDNETIQLPWLITNVKDIIAKQQLMEVKTMVVKPHMFRSLCMRCLLDNSVRFEDVLAYARTLGSAYETSEINFKMKYTVRVDVLRNTAYAAWYYHQQMGKKFSLAAKMWANVAESNNSLLITNLTSMIKEMLLVFTTLSEGLESLTEAVNSILLAKGAKLGLPINWLAECDDRLKVLLISPSGSLIPYPTDDDTDADAWSTSSGDGYDDLDDDGDNDSGGASPAPSITLDAWDALLDREDGMSEGKESDNDDYSQSADTAEIMVAASQEVSTACEQPTPTDSVSWTAGLSSEEYDWLDATRHMCKGNDNLQRIWSSTTTVEKSQWVTMLNKWLPGRAEDMGNSQLTAVDWLRLESVANTSLLQDMLKELAPTVRDFSALASMQRLLKGLNLLTQLDRADKVSVLLAATRIGTLCHTWLDDDKILEKLNSAATPEERGPIALRLKLRKWHEENRPTTSQTHSGLQSLGTVRKAASSAALPSSGDTRSHVIDDNSPWLQPSGKKLTPIPEVPPINITLKSCSDVWKTLCDGSTPDTAMMMALQQETIHNGFSNPNEWLYPENKAKAIRAVIHHRVKNEGKSSTLTKFFDELDKLHRGGDDTEIPLNPVPTPLQSKEVRVTRRNPDHTPANAGKEPNLWLSTVVGWMNRWAADNKDAALAMEIHTTMGALITSNKRVAGMISTLKCKRKPICLPTGSGQHILMMVVGSIGEITPMIKLGSLLLNTGLYSVTMCCQPDEGLTMPVEMGYSQVGVKVKPMQQLVIDQMASPHVSEATAVSYWTNGQFLKAGLAVKDVDVVIANVICYTAGTIARHNKAKLIITTPALEITSQHGSYHNFLAGAATTDERFALNPLLGAAWFNLTKEMSTDVVIDQLEFRQRPIHGLFPKEWLTLNTEPLKFDIQPLFGMENINTNDIDESLNAYDFVVLAGSTFGPCWKHVMLQVVRCLANERVIIALTFNNPVTHFEQDIGLRVADLPRGFKVVKWVNYRAIHHKVVITHGGAGVMANITSAKNKIVVVPMIGDNYANAKWASKASWVRTMMRKDNNLADLIAELQQENYGRIDYEHTEDAIKTRMAVNLVTKTTNNNIHCKCKRQHVLLHFIGTRGDFNSIVPAAVKLAGTKHVIAITHDDFITGLPEGWMTVPLNTDSTTLAGEAAAALDVSWSNLTGPVKHYQRLSSESLSAVKRITMKIDCVMTSFFTPFSTRIGAFFKCPVLTIDAIPNRPFYVDGKEIITKLPIVITDRGDRLRHSVMEALDSQALATNELNSLTIQVVTCHRELYTDYIVDEPDNPILNLLVNDKATRGRKTSLNLSAGNNVLITFGSIPTPDRVLDVLKLLQMDPVNSGTTFYASGKGNFNDLWSHPNYIAELNYPDDLRMFDVVVHHGGVGTTWNCMKAKTIQVIWPIFGDQFIWAEYVRKENVGFRIDNPSELALVLADLMMNKHRLQESIAETVDRKLYNYEDDESTILKTLNWGVNVKENLLWPFVVDQPGAPCNLQPGDYVSTAVMDLTVHSPTAVLGCVRDCVNKACVVVKDSPDLVNWSNPNHGEMIRILRLININYRLFLGGEVSSMEIVDSAKPILSLDVSKVGTSYHCTIVDAHETGIPELKPMNTIEESEALGENTMTALIAKGGSIAELTLGKSEMQTKALEKIASIHYDLTTRLTRQQHGVVTIQPVEIVGRENMYIHIGSSQLKNDWVYVTRKTTTNKPSMLYVVVLQDKSVLRLINGPKLVGQKVMLMSLQRMDLGVQFATKSKLRTSDWFFINAGAKKADMMKKRNGLPVLHNEKHYKLIVNKVDNQKHDKYDAVRAIKQAEDYVLPDGLSKDDFERWFFSDRQVYLDGKLYVKLDNQPTNSLQQVMCTVNTSRHVLKQVYGTWYVDVKQNMKIINNQLGTPEKKELTWAELKANDIDAEIVAGIEKRWSLLDTTVFQYDPTYRTKVGVSMAATVTRLALAEGALILGQPVAAYKPKVVGAGLLAKSYSWWTSSSPTSTHSGDWWGLKRNNPTTLASTGAVRSVEAQQGQLAASVVVATTSNATSGISGYHTQDLSNELTRKTWEIVTNVTHLPDFDAMVFWSDDELTDWLACYAPFESKMTSTEWAQKMVTSKKHTLTEFPTLARPVHTKAAFEEQRSIAGRLFSVKRIRKRVPNIDRTMEYIYLAFFHDKANEMVRGFKAEPLFYNSKASIEWMERHKSTDRVYEDLKKTLQAGAFIEKLSDVKIHIKLESLLKQADKVIKRHEQQKARIIVWQRYAVAAIFSPIFTEAKKRMHSLFNNRVVYADGKTPEQLSSFMRGTGNKTKYVMSTDLEQQDRQTDDPIINVEFKLYADLGVHADVLSAWRMVHEDWRFKGTYTKGHRRSMRLTGQATTSIGNVINTMQTHAQFVYENRDKVTFVLILGDDNCIGLSETVDYQHMKRETADNFNMVSKTELTENFGEFCHFLVYKTNSGYWEMGPDYVRLRNRFEVTNGVSEVTVENMALRTMSYAMTVGATPEVTHLVESEHWPIRPTMWYDEASATQAMMARYDYTFEQVRANYHMLLHMMTEREIYEKRLTIMTSKPRKH